jgi:uncharacterized membrane protein
MQARKKPGSAPRFQAIRAHLPLFTGLVVALVAGVGASIAIRLSAAALIGWDLGVLVYLVMVWRRIVGATPASIRRHAGEIDENKWAVLTVTVGAGLISVIALGAELIASKGAPDAGLRAVLAIVSISLSWIFVHTVFGLFYAHEWHRGDRALAFPASEKDEPDYFDFLYVSFGIGMTFQVSDVQAKTAGMRKLILAHAIISFAFTMVILALGVNLSASLL